MTLEVLMRQAAAALGAGDLGRAESFFRQVLMYNPRDAGAWHALAIIGCRSGRGAEALDCAMHAHKLDRRNHVYLNTVGVACFESGRIEESLRWFRRCLGEKPAYAEAHYNLAKAFKRLEQFEPAEQAYRSALRIDPSMADAANNLASLCIRAGRYDEALELLDRARLLTPDAATVAINGSLALLAKHGPASAIEHISGFLARYPHSAEAHYHFASRLLAEGRFAEGWREYAWRHRIPGSVPPPGLAQELPQDLEGRSVVLVPDQGLGDQLFFLRFARLLRERGARVLFACPEKMLAMLEKAPGVDEIIPADAGSPPDVPNALLVALGDLPRLIPERAVQPPFAVGVPAERRSAWRTRLADLGPPPYLGVTWRAGTKRQKQSEFAPAGLDALYKEIELQVLAQAAAAWRGSILVLQRLPAPGEVAAFAREIGRQVHDLSPLNERLEDMAAVLAIIDDYVGVSNTNMHIRAGVKKTAKVLVPFPAEFRWMHAGEGSPWYPGFRVFRQSPSLDWTSALAELTRSLLP